MVKGTLHNLYYLCRGYNVTDYENCDLKKINDSTLTGLENIDLYTSKFYTYIEMKEDLLKRGLIEDINEDVVIGQYKTISGRKKRLVPIYLKQFVFKTDLNRLGFKFDSYSELADNLYDYIVNRQNDRSFLLVIITEILDKYISAKKTVKIPIVKDNILQSIKRYLEGSEPLGKKQKIYLERVFINEIFEFKQEVELLDAKNNIAIVTYKKIDGTHKGKTLHDLLIRVCNYINTYDVPTKEEEIEAYIQQLEDKFSYDSVLCDEIELIKDKALRRSEIE